MFARKPSPNAVNEATFPLASDAYWTPPQPAALVEVPPAMFMYAAPTIAKMKVLASAVLEKEHAAPMGEFFFLVDQEKTKTLAAYAFMDECSEPIWVDSIDLAVVGRELKEHCRRYHWRTEPYA